MLKYDGAFAYDNDAYHACVLFCLQNYGIICYNLTKLIKYYVYKSIFCKSRAIYDFYIYVRFTRYFGIYSILEHKNHKNQVYSTGFWCAIIKSR